MGIKLRIQADTREECEVAIGYLTTLSSGAVKMGKPREGTNPKYDGAQKWSSYGEIVLPASRTKRSGVL